jgi:starvation-inducible DNA-binding protein
MKNNIGLDVQKSNELVEKLNNLLANYQVFYQNLRGFHWNIKGKDFFELHIKFEEYYEDAVIKIDEIAERILTLQGVPYHTFTDYLAHSEIKPVKKDRVGRESVAVVIENFSSLIRLERVILSIASEAEDEGTVSQMSDYITETEKTLWMLNSYMG